MTPSPPADALPAPANAPAAPPPAAPPVPVPAPDGAAAEAAAWAEVLAAWDDEGRHRDYLAGIRDLEGLAEAGRRYRAALAARPGDPLAARFREEVLKRAVAQGLASLPRSAPEHPRARVAIRTVAAVVAGALLLAAVVMAVRLLSFGGGAAP